MCIYAQFYTHWCGCFLVKMCKISYFCILHDFARVDGVAPCDFIQRPAHYNCLVTQTQCFFKITPNIHSFWEWEQIIIIIIITENCLLIVFKHYIFFFYNLQLFHQFGCRNYKPLCKVVIYTNIFYDDFIYWKKVL